MERRDVDDLRRTIWESQKWPQKYVFKFIVPNVDGKVKEVVASLPEDAKLTYKHTKNLRHVSVTAISIVESLEKVQKINQKVSAIQGVISL